MGETSPYLTRRGNNVKSNVMIYSMSSQVPKANIQFNPCMLYSIHLLYFYKIIEICCLHQYTQHMLEKLN